MNKAIHHKIDFITIIRIGQKCSSMLGARNFTNVDLSFSSTQAYYQFATCINVLGFQFVWLINED